MLSVALSYAVSESAWVLWLNISTWKEEEESEGHQADEQGGEGVRRRRSWGTQSGDASDRMKRWRQVGRFENNSCTRGVRNEEAGKRTIGSIRSTSLLVALPSQKRLHQVGPHELTDGNSRATREQRTSAKVCHTPGEDTAGMLAPKVLDMTVSIAQRKSAEDTVEEAEPAALSTN